MTIVIVKQFGPRQTHCRQDWARGHSLVSVWDRIISRFWMIKAVLCAGYGKDTFFPSSFLKIFIYVCLCHICMWVPLEARRGHWSPWSWSCGLGSGNWTCSICKSSSCAYPCWKRTSVQSQSRTFWWCVLKYIALRDDFKYLFSVSFVPAVLLGLRYQLIYKAT